MASSTRQARQSIQQKLDGLKGIDLQLALELFAIANALQSSAQLRSLLSDPSAEQQTKDGAVNKVFAGLSDAARELARFGASLRWSAVRDQAAAFEVLGVRAIAAQSKNLDALQTELFEIEQLSAHDAELELALSSTRAEAQSKEALIDALLGKKASPDALALAKQAVYSRSYKRFAEVIEQYGLWLAEFAGESVAHIRVAKELSSAQLERLGKALGKAFGRELQLNVEVDPEVLGGVHVTIGGEVLDGTVLTKLVNARLQLG